MAAVAVLTGISACASAHPPAAPVPVPAAVPDAAADSAHGPSPATGSSPMSAVACEGCASLPMAPELAAALRARVAKLKSRGGDCATYGAVLEDALVSGRIVIRPYMWRVRGNLASAEGESSGEMTLARDIDSLNVGVRTLDDVA
ncbi:MAG TPA: hypothetical protein VN613_07575, partial [Gemmatimonadaceae bacterium]|nr:hypothetical protein [Gemmatimonadaceae bacterium]